LIDENSKRWFASAIQHHGRADDFGPAHPIGRDFPLNRRDRPNCRMRDIQHWRLPGESGGREEQAG
jgi:hypothetical protein